MIEIVIERLYLVPSIYIGVLSLSLDNVVSEGGLSSSICGEEQT